MTFQISLAVKQANPAQAIWIADYKRLLKVRLRRQNAYSCHPA